MHRQVHGENSGGEQTRHCNNSDERPLTAKQSYICTGQIQQNDTRRHDEDKNAKEYIGIPYPFSFSFGGAQFCFKNKPRLFPLLLCGNDIERPVYGGT